MRAPPFEIHKDNSLSYVRVKSEIFIAASFIIIQCIHVFSIPSLFCYRRNTEFEVFCRMSAVYTVCSTTCVGMILILVRVRYLS